MNAAVSFLSASEVLESNNQQATLASQWKAESLDRGLRESIDLELYHASRQPVRQRVVTASLVMSNSQEEGLSAYRGSSLLQKLRSDLRNKQWACEMHHCSSRWSRRRKLWVAFKNLFRPSDLKILEIWQPDIIRVILTAV